MENVTDTEVETPGASPDPPPAWRQAILVAHGVGQQQPFQVLDSFAHGLVRALSDDGYRVKMQHIMLGREATFDHAIRLTAIDGGRPSVAVDVYEFYWASLAQGKASFVDTIRWIRETAFTPLKRLAFNLSLVIQLTRGHGFLSVLGGLAREVWRIIYIFFAFLGIAALATVLVVNSTTLGKQLWAATTELYADLTWADAFTGFVFAGLLVALAALLWSLPAQVADIAELHRRVGRRKRGVLQLFHESAGPSGQGWRSNRFLAAPSRVANTWSAWSKDEANWTAEIRARRRFLICSALACLLVGGMLWLGLRQQEPHCVGPVCMTPILSTLVSTLEESNPGTAHSPAELVRVIGSTLRADTDQLTPIPTLTLGQRLAILLGLVILATLVKRVFIDYVGDVALYATADENSAFFATRTKILEEMSRKLRWLIRQRDYDHVAIAGHSLGSVIVYDAVNRLRVESRLAVPPLEARNALAELKELMTKLPANEQELAGLHVATLEGWLDSPSRVSAERADDIWRGLMKLGAKTLPAPLLFTIEPLVREFVAQLGTALPPSKHGEALIRPGELRYLETLITFGSPLDKIVYFFRTKLRACETVRAHIINELYGYRRCRELLQSDPDILDTPQGPVVPDNVYWLNVWSPMDPISARLRFFDGVDNRVRRYVWWGAAHTKYWRDSEFYRLTLLAMRGQLNGATRAAGNGSHGSP
jgi:hypothetical protein